MADLADQMNQMKIQQDNTAHPWQKFYDSEPARPIRRGPREMYSRVTLEQVQQFRDISKNVWVNEPRTGNEVEFKKVEIRTSDEIPKGPFAYYSVIANRGNFVVLTPVFNEVVAQDRLDLKLVHLNKNARDIMNLGCFDSKEHPIGDVVCVTKLQSKQKLKDARIEKIEAKDIMNPDGKYFWEVAEYFHAPRDIKKEVIASPYFFDRRRQLYSCVGAKFTDIVEMDRNILPDREEPINHLLSTTVFTPIIRPGQFLSTLKESHWLTVAKLSPKLVTSNSYSPKVLDFEDAPNLVRNVFENYNEAFRHWDRENAYRALKMAVEFGSNGLYAIKNQHVDSHMYTTQLVKPITRHPYIYFCFNIVSANSIPPAKKWNRAVSVKIQSKVTGQFFFADVLSAQKNKLSLDVRARASTESFNASLFEQMKNENVHVQQRKEQKPCEINYDIEEGSNADKVIQSLYGGAPLPQITPLSTNPIRAGELVLLDTQTRYTRMVADPKVSALIGSSSFGCGKTATIAVAALFSLQQSKETMQMVTAITNSAVVSLIEKLEQINPNVRIVRIISAQNTTQLPSTQLTKFDYPTVLAKFLKEHVINEDKVVSGFAGAVPEELLKQMMFYLKSKSLLSERSLNSERMKLLFKKSTNCNDEDLLNFFIEFKKPTIVVGTVQSILNAFNLPWQSYIQKIATIQIDEASTLPRETLLQMVTLFPNARYSLVGDYRQLSPYYVANASTLLIETAIGDTLRDCVTNNLLPSVYFNGVFRCRPEVTSLLGELFYDSSLESLHKQCITEDQLVNCPAWKIHRKNQYPIVFINTDGSKHRRRGTSLRNIDEAESAMDLARHLLKFVDKENIAILCFYRAQMNEMREFGENSGIYVGSVDSAQGREWPVCIICTTRTNSFVDSQFLTNNNRINVALSRSKHLNFILGSVKNMHDAKNWKNIIATCSEQSTLVRSGDFDEIIDPEGSSIEDQGDYDDDYEDGEEH